MAEVVWTEPALADLEAIADYIAIENPAAAGEFVRRVFAHVDKLERHPLLGSVPSELEQARYRQIVEPPCRIFYRHEEESVFILHVMRSERLLREIELERAREIDS
jgi:plasmid stabilization system protein ParE